MLENLPPECSCLGCLEDQEISAVYDQVFHASPAVGPGVYSVDKHI